MNTFESWVFTYVLNSLWQAPLVFVAAWVAARIARETGPRIEHRVWVGALVLEMFLPACHFHMTDLWGLLLRVWSGNAAGGGTRVFAGPGTVSGAGALRFPEIVVAAVIGVYACSLIYFAGRLGWALWKTSAMRRQATPVMLTEEAVETLDRCSRYFNIPRNTVQVAASPMISGPVTAGVRRRTVLLPPGFLKNISADDLDAVFAHEFAHLWRQDFIKNLIYGVLALPIAYHPLLWLTRSRLAEAREMVCDALAAQAVTGRENYVRSLLRLASMLSAPTAARTLQAIGIFDANVFERRIMNLTRKHIETRGLRRLAIAALCGTIAVATCASAMAFRMNVDDTSAAAQKTPPKQIHVNADNLKTVHKAPPVYPVEAKEHKIQGSVVLSVIIGKDGVPAEVKVQDGPKELRQSALDAVRQWRWQPYLLNGDPIEVLTTITVVYSLAG